jgi:hypothetical protein
LSHRKRGLLGSGVGHFGERKIQSVQPGNQAEPSSRHAPPGPHTQIAAREQEERDSEKEEYGPQTEIEAEGWNPTGKLTVIGSIVWQVPPLDFRLEGEAPKVILLCECERPALRFR